jgi:predicted transport protein
MHQRMATGFKDLAIELWEIKKYTNNTYLFNKIESQYKDESISKISRSKDSEAIGKVIVVYSEDSHLEKCDESIKGVYNELRDKILSISPAIRVNVNKKYIAFVSKRNFVSVFTKRSTLELQLALKKGELNDPRHLARDLSKYPYQPSTTQYAVNVDDKSDLGYILSLIIQAYDKANPK